MRAPLRPAGYLFTSQTDTEVIAHLVDSPGRRATCLDGQGRGQTPIGAYAIARCSIEGIEPHRVVGARAGSPRRSWAWAADMARTSWPATRWHLAGVTDQIVYLDEGDVVDPQLGKYWLVDKAHKAGAQRRSRWCKAHSGAAELGPLPALHAEGDFRAAARHRRHAGGRGGIVPTCSTPGASDGAADVFKAIDSVLIPFCGTSYYSGCTAWYWLESIAGIPDQVEVASDTATATRCRTRSLVVTITQSGETADTLARCAMRRAWACARR